MNILQKIKQFVNRGRRDGSPSIPQYVPVQMYDALTISALYGYNAVAWDDRNWKSLGGVR